MLRGPFPSPQKTVATHVKALPFDRTVDSLDGEWRKARQAAGFGPGTLPGLRVAQHEWARVIPFNRCAAIAVPRLVAEDIEHTYIRRERPPYNTRGNQ